MQSAMSNGGGLTSPLNSMIRRSINPVYDDAFNPVAGNSWPQFFKNALCITPPRTHTTPANFGGTPIVLRPANNGAVLAAGTLMCGPGAPSATAPNLRIGYAGNQSFEMRQGGSFQVHFAVGGAIGTSLSSASQYNIASSGHLGFSASNTNTSGLQNADTAWFRPAAGFMGLRSIVSPTSTQVLQIYNTFTDSANYERLAFQFGTYSSVRHTQIAAESEGTGTANINLVLTPKGTGAFILGPPPDGTVTGGNARGSKAVDLQTLRSVSTQVASGPYSFLVGRNNTGSGWYSAVTGQNCVGSGWYTLVAGNENTASGEASFALGYLNQISGSYSGAAGFDNIIGGDYSFAFGRGHRNTSGNSYVSLFGEGAGQGQSWDFLHACGKFAVAGDCVRRAYVQRGATTNLSSSANLTPRFILQPNQIFHGTIKVTGVKTDGTTYAFYERQVRIIRVNNTTTLLGVNVIGTDVTNNTTLTVTADDLLDSLNIQVTSTGNWRWQAVIDGGSTIFV